MRISSRSHPLRVKRPKVRAPHSLLTLLAAALLFLSACGDDTKSGSERDDAAAESGGDAKAETSLSETEQLVADFVDLSRESDPAACDLVTETLSTQAQPITDPDPEPEAACRNIRLMVADPAAASDAPEYEDRKGPEGETLVDLQYSGGGYTFVLVDEGGKWKIDRRIDYGLNPGDVETDSYDPYE